MNFNMKLYASIHELRKNYF